MPDLAEGELPGPDIDVPVLASTSQEIQLPDPDTRVRDNPLFARLEAFLRQ